MILVLAAACSSSAGDPPRPDLAPLAPIAPIAPIAPMIDAAPPAAIVVTDITGGLERRTGGSWTAIETGEHLAEDAVVRTAAQGSATIAFGDHVEIQLGGSRASELRLGSPIQLADGQLTADVKPGGAGFGAAFAATDAIAETADGKFSAITDGDGTVTVLAARGTTQLRANGGAVEIPAGSQSIVARAEGPSAPAAIPTSLFLKVKAASRGGSAAITGRTTPGALVSIDGVAIGVASTGTFSHQVPATTAKILVEVDDAAGRHRSDEVAVGAKPADVTGKITF